MTLFLIYVYVCLAVGLLGHGTRAGVLGTTLLAFVFTPLLALVFVVAFGRRSPRALRPVAPHASAHPSRNR